jgi:hypothetical protein
MVEGEHRSLSAEKTMAEPSRDPKTSKSEPEKKQPETVLLTAEELRAIAGGKGSPIGGTGNGPPSGPSTDDPFKNIKR